MGVLDQIIRLDRDLFRAINGAHAPLADTVMLGASNMVMWFPLYCGFLALVWGRWGKRAFWWSLPVLAAMIWCSDSGSVLLFKETVHRLRPCHAPGLEGMVRVLGECGGQYGFVSSHASNHFAIATFMVGVLHGRSRWERGAILLWAAVVAYSRIYLGVHYPADVVVGALYGALIGSIFFLIFRAIAEHKAKT